MLKTFLSAAVALSVLAPVLADADDLGPSLRDPPSFLQAYPPRSTHLRLEPHWMPNSGVVAVPIYTMRNYRACEPLRGVPGCYPFGSRIRTLNERTVVVDSHGHMIAILD